MAIGGSSSHENLGAVYFFQDFCFGRVSWTSWGTRFQVGMTGVDQCRYLRRDK